jgi:hypothetical protein
LREVFTARHGAQALEQLRLDADRGALEAPPSGTPRPAEAPLWRRALNVAQGEPNVKDPGAWYNAIGKRLAAGQPLAPDALTRLATARSNAIVDALKDAGVDAARIAQPTVEKAEAAGKVVPLKLGLAAR